jgi:succinyl-diaminopimelate desuccinylase
MDGNTTGFRQEIDKWFELHSEGMLNDLGRLIEVKSVMGPPANGAPYGVDSRTALALAGSILEARGFAVSEFKDMIITADLGPEPPKLGILAHLDVVDPGEGWDFYP